MSQLLPSPPAYQQNLPSASTNQWGYQNQANLSYPQFSPAQTCAPQPSQPPAQNYYPPPVQQYSLPTQQQYSSYPPQPYSSYPPQYNPDPYPPLYNQSQYPASATVSINPDSYPASNPDPRVSRSDPYASQQWGVSAYPPVSAPSRGTTADQARALKFFSDLKQSLSRDYTLYVLSTWCTNK